MAQIHPFINPFAKSPFSIENKPKIDPFMPYEIFLKYCSKNSPLSSLPISINWVELQQKLWQDYITCVSYQQEILQQNIMASAKVMTHCMQLSSNPSHFYRYVRRNWQKPYINLGAQAINGSKLYTKLLTDCFCSWQNTFMNKEIH